MNVWSGYSDDLWEEPMGDTKFRQTHRRTRDESLSRETILPIKREEAAERQAYRDTLTNEQQLAVIKGRRGNSKRETERLTNVS